MTADYGEAAVSVLTANAAGDTFGAPRQYQTLPRPESVVFSPSGTLLAETSISADEVSVYSVSSSGALQVAPGSPYPAGRAPEGAAFNPSGSLLAVADAGSDSVSVYAVGAGGRLTEVPDSPVRTGTDPVAVAFSPSGSLMAVSDAEQNSVSVFRVATGGIGEVAGSPFPAGGHPLSLAFNPSGTTLAVADESTNSVLLFSVDAGGSLRGLGAPVATGTQPVDVAFSPSGDLLATANLGDNTITAVSLSAAGAIRPATGSPFGVGARPDSLAFSRSGKLLAVADYAGGEVSAFSVSDRSSGSGAGGSPSSGSGGEGSSKGALTRCAIPRSSRFHGLHFGSVALGMTRSLVERRLSVVPRHRRGRVESVCAGASRLIFEYGAPSRSGVPAAVRRRLRGRVVLILTRDHRHQLSRVHPGSSLRDLRIIRHIRPLRVHGASWYFVVRRQVTDVVEARRGRVRAVGIANLKVSRRREARRALIGSL